jgi:hypothetical protein
MAMRNAVSLTSGVWTLAVLAALSGTRAGAQKPDRRAEPRRATGADTPSTVKVELIALQVRKNLSPAGEGADPMLYGVSMPPEGTLISLLVTSPDRPILGLGLQDSQILALTDDKGTDLKPTPAELAPMGSSGMSSVAGPAGQGSMMGSGPSDMMRSGGMMRSRPGKKDSTKKGRPETVQPGTLGAAEKGNSGPGTRTGVGDGNGSRMRRLDGASNVGRGAGTAPMGATAFRGGFHRNTDRAYVSLHVPRTPAPGASTLHLRARLVLRLRGPQSTLERDNVAVKEGTKIEEGPITLTFSVPTAPGRLDLGPAVVVRARHRGDLSPVKSIVVVGADGVETEPKGSRFLDADGNTGLSYPVDRKLKKVGLRLTYYGEDETITVPVDLRIGIGL